MPSKLYCYQLKIGCYKYKIHFVNTKEKAFNYKKSSNHKRGEQDKKQGIEDLQISQNTISKMVIAYLSIFTLNINGLIPPIIAHRKAEWTKIKIQWYAAYKGITIVSKAHTLTRDRKYILSKW